MAHNGAAAKSDIKPNTPQNRKTGIEGSSRYRGECMRVDPGAQERNTRNGPRVTIQTKIRV